MYGGAKNPPEPVLRDHRNIRCGDAVLAWDGEPYRTSKRRWDGETFKPHPVTGLPIPDEAAEVAEVRYIRPRKADEWSKADFIVGNPQGKTWNQGMVSRIASARPQSAAPIIANDAKRGCSVV